jgi:spore coat protein U-like protein
MKRLQYWLFVILACSMVITRASGAAVCSVSSTGTAFGTFDTLSGLDDNILGTISVTCTGNIGDPVNYTIALGPGGGSFVSRIMQAGTPQLNYNLYKDAAHMSVWGDGSGGTATVSDSYSLAATSNTLQYPVYGSVPGTQSGAVAGSYSDNILITLNY